MKTGLLLEGAGVRQEHRGNKHKSNLKRSNGFCCHQIADKLVRRGRLVPAVLAVSVNNGFQKKHRWIDRKDDVQNSCMNK